MIPIQLYKATSIIVFCLGGLVVVLGLTLLAQWLGYRIIDHIGNYKRLHAYIKDHKVEFMEWGREYNRRQDNKAKRKFYGRQERKRKRRDKEKISRDQ